MKMSNKGGGKANEGDLLSWSLQWSNGAPSCLDLWGPTSQGTEERIISWLLAPIGPGLIWNVNSSSIQVCTYIGMLSPWWCWQRHWVKEGKAISDSGKG